MLDKSLCIGIPLMDYILAQSFPSIVNLIVRGSEMFGDVSMCAPRRLCPYANARQWILEQAIKQGSDYLLFLDSDQTFPLNTVEVLCKTMEIKECQLVSGYSWRRGYPYTSVWVKDKSQIACDGGVTELDASGLFCALIDVNWVKDNLDSPFFTSDLPEDKGSGEDAIFCFKIRRAGGSVWGNGHIRCGHLSDPIVIDDRSITFLRKRHHLDYPDEEVDKSLNSNGRLSVLDPSPSSSLGVVNPPPRSFI